MAWWERAYAGQKVVCVDDTVRDRPPPGYTFSGDLDGLKAGAVYTVRRIGADWLDGEICVWLDEIFRPPLEGEPEESGFSAFRFRPVQPKSTETGMKMIRKLLDSAPVKEDA